MIVNDPEEIAAGLEKKQNRKEKHGDGACKQGIVIRERVRLGIHRDQKSCTHALRWKGVSSKSVSGKERIQYGSGISHKLTKTFKSKVHPAKNPHVSRTNGRGAEVCPLKTGERKTGKLGWLKLTVGRRVTHNTGVISLLKGWFFAKQGQGLRGTDEKKDLVQRGDCSLHSRSYER